MTQRSPDGIGFRCLQTQDTRVSKTDMYNLVTRGRQRRSQNAHMSINLTTQRECVITAIMSMVETPNLRHNAHIHIENHMQSTGVNLVIKNTD